MTAETLAQIVATLEAHIEDCNVYITRNSGADWARARKSGLCYVLDMLEGRCSPDGKY